jgi:tellurite methyltransferase
MSYWSSYYDAARDNTPRPTLIAALNSLNGPPGFAIDLGCGAGTDTLALLTQGWRVQAIDAEEDALLRLERRVPAAMRDRLRLTLSRFETLDLPKANLVNASFALPFCMPAKFDYLWASIAVALDPSGMFAGHLFGNNDTWSGLAHINTHTRFQVEGLLAGWKIVQLLESEWDGTAATGEAKHWHLFEIVARRDGT